MDDDDLPPKTRESNGGFAGQLGGMFAGVVGIGFFLILAGVALFWVMRWMGHSPW